MDGWAKYFEHASHNAQEEEKMEEDKTKNKKRKLISQQDSRDVFFSLLSACTGLNCILGTLPALVRSFSESAQVLLGRGGHPWELVQSFFFKLGDIVQESDVSLQAAMWKALKEGGGYRLRDDRNGRLRSGISSLINLAQSSLPSAAGWVALAEVLEVDGVTWLGTIGDEATWRKALKTKLEEDR